MQKQSVEVNNLFVALEERAQLVHFCARMTNNRDIAEDLAQETLLIAWNKESTLRDAERYSSWLFGIARNVCLRWLRVHGRDSAHLIQLQPEHDEALSDPQDMLADDLDVELVLERKELIELLDRALTMLPLQTRTILIQRYVEESPLGEIAAQLGTNASAIAMRLQRGKLVLRRILSHEMKQELELYTNNGQSTDWEVTPLWCPGCGQQRLLGQRDPAIGKLYLKCPRCSSDENDIFNKNHLSALKGIRGYKPLASRLAAWCNHNYREGLRAGSVACPGCGRMVPASIQMPADFPSWLRDSQDMQIWARYRNERLVTIQCVACVSSCNTTLEALVLESPQGQRFQKAHPRIRTLPRQYIESNGCAAILTRFESVTDNATLDIISDDETYEILHIW